MRRGLRLSLGVLFLLFVGASIGLYKLIESGTTQRVHYSFPDLTPAYERTIRIGAISLENSFRDAHGRHVPLEKRAGLFEFIRLPGAMT